MAASLLAWSGLLAVWKPPTVRSTEVVNQLKNIVINHRCPSLPRVRRCKVGHGGTLDAFAEGVLVVGFGDATKKLGEFQQSSSTKMYVACGVLGVATDTYDPTGEETCRKSFDHVSAESMSAILPAQFLGDIMQRPPPYSALKKNGVRFSDLNRAGQDVAPEVRQRHVSEIKLLNFDPPFFTISITCNSGTYVRSLVHDIGEALDTVAHVHTLKRLQVNHFTQHDALLPENWTPQGVFHALHGQSVAAGRSGVTPLEEE